MVIYRFRRTAFNLPMDRQIEDLEKQLKEIEALVQEAEKRLPAHSAKPSTMALLFDLEDKRDAILKQLEKLKEDDYENG